MYGKNSADDIGYQSHIQGVRVSDDAHYHCCHGTGKFSSGVSNQTKRLPRYYDKRSENDQKGRVGSQKHLLSERESVKGQWLYAWSVYRIFRKRKEKKNIAYLTKHTTRIWCWESSTTETTSTKLQRPTLLTSCTRFHQWQRISNFCFSRNGGSQWIVLDQVTRRISAASWTLMLLRMEKAPSRSTLTGKTSSTATGRTI